VQDSKITQLGVCLDPTQLAPVESVPIDIDQFYLCGTVEGTTFRTGTLYIFYLNEVVFQDGVKLDPGAFFLPISPDQFEISVSGRYRAEVRYRQVLAKTEFTLTRAGP
jgi:hypothetical protein